MDDGDFILFESIFTIEIEIKAFMLWNCAFIVLLLLEGNLELSLKRTMFP